MRRGTEPMVALRMGEQLEKWQHLRSADDGYQQAETEKAEGDFHPGNCAADKVARGENRQQDPSQQNGLGTARKHLHRDRKYGTIVSYSSVRRVTLLHPM